LLSGYRQHTEILKTDSEGLFPDGSGHIFNFCHPEPRKPILESGDTNPRSFSVAKPVEAILE
jgi:hypothetical protein